MKFTGVMLNSEKPDELAVFYTKILGEPGWKGDGGWYGYRAHGQIMIGPHSEVKGKNDTPGRIMLTFEVSDVTAEFARIHEAGGGVVAEPYHPDKENDQVMLATLSDPDGNYVQLSSPWPES